MAKLLRQRKGQSAIEYLTTYGWMLLVIAIVGGAIFSTVQNSSQIESTSGFQNADVRIVDFGVTGDSGFQMEIRGAAQEQVENVNVTLREDVGDETISANSQPTIPVGDTETISFDNITSVDETNTFDVGISYNTGGLDGLQINGTMTGQFELDNSGN